MHWSRQWLWTVAFLAVAAVSAYTGQLHAHHTSAPCLCAITLAALAGRCSEAYISIHGPLSSLLLGLQETSVTTFSTLSLSTSLCLVSCDQHTVGLCFFFSFFFLVLLDCFNVGGRYNGWPSPCGHCPSHSLPDSGSRWTLFPQAGMDIGWSMSAAWTWSQHWCAGPGVSPCPGLLPAARNCTSWFLVTLCFCTLGSF